MYKLFAVVALVLVGLLPTPADAGWRHDRRIDKRWHRRHPGWWGGPGWGWQQPPPPWWVGPPQPPWIAPPPVRPVPPIAPLPPPIWR